MGAGPSVQLWKDHWVIPILANGSPPSSERFIELCSDPEIDDPMSASIQLTPKIQHSNELLLDITDYDPYGRRCQLFRLSFRPVTPGTKRYLASSGDCAQGTESCNFSLGITVSVKTPEQYQQELIGRFYQLGQYLITGKGPLLKNIVFIDDDRQLVISNENEAHVYNFDRSRMKLEYSHGFPVSDANDGVLCSGSGNSVIQLSPERGIAQRLDTQGKVLASTAENSLSVCRSEEEINLRMIGTCSSRNGGVSGYLEVRVTNPFGVQRWGYICDDNVDSHEVNLACNELGFLSGEIIPHSTASDERGERCNPLSSGTFVIDELSCSGTESQISDCDRQTDHNCRFEEVLSVECTGNTRGSQQPVLMSHSLCAGLSSEKDSIVQFCGGQELYRVDLSSVYEQEVVGQEVSPLLQTVPIGDGFNPTAYLPLNNNTVLLTNDTHAMLIDTQRSEITDTTTALKDRSLIAVIENNLVGINSDAPETLIWQEIVEGRFTSPEFRHSSGIKKGKTIGATKAPGIIAVAERTEQGDTLITFYGISLPDTPRPQLLQEEIPDNATTDAMNDDFLEVTDLASSGFRMISSSTTIVESLLLWEIFTSWAVLR